MPITGSLYDSSRLGQAADLQGVTVIAAWPHTGRTHQIRIHAAHAGLPLLGDELYGLKVGCCCPCLSLFQTSWEASSGKVEA